MQDRSLLGHLATRFAASPEQLATEALHYILESSSVAERALRQFLAAAGAALPGGLRLRTRGRGDDRAIPDLVGTDAGGRPVLAVEATFWAGLAGHQPVASLRRLPDDAGAVLLVLAPARRLPALWPELLRRCAAGGLAVGHRAEGAGGLLAAGVGARRLLALASWHALLAHLLRAAEAEGQDGVAADVRQLLGLCARMDSEAFLPLRAEGPTADVARQVLRYGGLVDSVAERLVAAGLASARGLRANATKAWYGRYLRIGPYGALLRCSAWRWGDVRPTPLWLHLYALGGPRQDYPVAARERLRALELEDPPRLLTVNDELAIPLTLPTEAAREEVVRALFEEVRAIAALLGAPVADREGGGTMRAFIDDDRGYLAWVGAHPDGFVLNASNPPNPWYLRIHRATCHTISGTPSNGAAWTVGYVKVCSTAMAYLYDWAATRTGGAATPCGRCTP